MMRWLSLVGVRPATNPVLTPALESLESLTDKNGLANGPAIPFSDCVTKESLPHSVFSVADHAILAIGRNSGPACFPTASPNRYLLIAILLLRTPSRYFRTVAKLFYLRFYGDPNLPVKPPKD